jgi:hypothetical protein
MCPRWALTSQHNSLTRAIIPDSERQCRIDGHVVKRGDRLLVVYPGGEFFYYN